MFWTPLSHSSLHWWAENLRIFTQSWFQFYKRCDKSSWSVESDILTSNRWTPNLSVNKRSVLPTSMCALWRSVLALYFKTSPQLLTVVIGQVCIILVRVPNLYFGSIQYSWGTWLEKNQHFSGGQHYHVYRPWIHPMWRVKLEQAIFCFSKFNFFSSDLFPHLPGASILHIKRDCKGLTIQCRFPSIYM